jgi:hypothetical protein
MNLCGVLMCLGDEYKIIIDFVSDKIDLIIQNNNNKARASQI